MKSKPVEKYNDMRNPLLSLSSGKLESQEGNQSHVASTALTTSTPRSYMNTMYAFLEETFEPEKRGSTVGREIQAGAILFFTSAYLFVMNPTILSIAGIDRSYTYISTILVAVAGTTLASLWCNLPIIIAPAMGLNTLFAVELVSTKHVPVSLAHGAAFLMSVALIILSQTGTIMKFINWTPTCLKKSIIVSLGLFQAVIGMNALKWIIPADTDAVGGISRIGTHYMNTESLVAFVTIFTTLLLVTNGIEGAVFYGIVTGSLVSHLLIATPNDLAVDSNTTYITNLVGALTFPSQYDLETFFSFATSAFTMFLVTLIDASGVLLGLASHDRSLQDDEGMMIKTERIVCSVGISGALSAYIGCSPPVVLLESAAAISFGARTGLASFVCTVLYIGCLLFRGLVELVPPSVGHAVLIIVGSFMMGAVSGISWDNISEAFPSYATIIATVFTCSLANGTGTGFIVYAILNLPRWFLNTMKTSKPKELTTNSNELRKDSDLESLGRRVSISDWTQMGIGYPHELMQHIRYKNRLYRGKHLRTMSSPDNL